jgi:hypothetical protein
VDINTGKTDSSKDAAVPLESKALREMLKCVSDPRCRVVFMDNFFTSYDRLAELRTLGFRATGTMREVRLKKCLLEEMEKVINMNEDHMITNVAENFGCKMERQRKGMLGIEL